MSYYEDLEVGRVFTVGGVTVGAEQAIEFARLYDPAYIPSADVVYVHRGPQISPWQAAAFSSRLLSNLAASQSSNGPFRHRETSPGAVRSASQTCSVLKLK